jgi:imidazolonepropionase-like amidohydrolase
MRRGVRLGVRSIEHGTSIDAPTAKIIADSETYVVSTLVVGDRALKFGREAGLSASSLGKLQEITNFGLQAFDHCVHAGTKIGFGTDLLGVLHPLQNAKFTLRRQATSAIDILKFATSVNAALINRTGELSVIAPRPLPTCWCWMETRPRTSDSSSAAPRRFSSS